MHYVFKLYVAGHGRNSMSAISSLKRLLERELKRQYELKIVDVLEDPRLAEEDRILATPTLIRVLPFPSRRVIGDLSNRDKVLIGLDLTLKPEERGNQSPRVQPRRSQERLFANLAQ